MQTLEMMEGVGLGEAEEEAVAEVVVHGGVETQLQDCSESLDGLLWIRMINSTLHCLEYSVF